MNDVKQNAFVSAHTNGNFKIMYEFCWHNAAFEVKLFHQFQHCTVSKNLWNTKKNPGFGSWDPYFFEKVYPRDHKNENIPCVSWLEIYFMYWKMMEIWQKNKHF